MVISNWVERKFEERRINREQMLIEQGREEGLEQGRKQGHEEGFEQGRAYERERIQTEVTSKSSDDLTCENGR